MVVWGGCRWAAGVLISAPASEFLQPLMPAWSDYPLPFLQYIIKVMGVTGSTATNESNTLTFVTPAAK